MSEDHHLPRHSGKEQNSQQLHQSQSDHLSHTNGADGGSDADQNYQFYKEYCRLYYANIILTNRLQ